MNVVERTSNRPRLEPGFFGSLDTRPWGVSGVDPKP